MAARKKSARNRENPSTVLIVFLVFFILLGIALGVTTYYGYAGQKKLEEDATNARKEAKAARNAEDYYKFQALTARAAQGPLVKNEGIDEPNDFTVLMDGFEDGSKFKEEKTRPAIEELVKTMKKTLGWDPNKKTFVETWFNLYKKQNDDLKSARADLQLAKDNEKKAEDGLRNVETKNETYWKETRNDIEKKHSEQLNAIHKKTAAMDDAFNRIQQLEGEKENLKNELEKERRKSNRRAEEDKKTIDGLEQKYAALKKQYEEQAAAVASANASLQVGDFAGKWSGSLNRGGAVSLDINANGKVIWTAPGISRESESDVSQLQKEGENYVLSIHNQQVKVYMANDRRTLRLSGAGMEATLTRR
jgi:hypothetical protein